MKTPLVLLHGFLGTAQDWDPTIEALGDDYRCKALNLPGHGRASDPVPPDFESVVHGTAERISRAFGVPVDLVGYSMGGRLALMLALEHRDLVRRVVAVGASPGIDDAVARVARRAEDERRARALETTDFQAWLRTWYDQPLFEGLSKMPGFDALLERRARARPAELAKVLRVLSTGRQPPLRQRLAESPVPLLLMAGAEDATYTASNHQLANSVESIDTATVPCAGHAPHLEQPDEFCRLLRAWLDRP
ncbi:MAG: 2-succinyl-6-hydroxy-2,4-cyclohexadiene-1-carboxylate synthase [Planctomycetota bacterium]|nr:2-succinyl-6-hydroxy-2,4-cyclohexadiene-1-carboxylate synthase [Planctomycetota bacterium]